MLHTTWATFLRATGPGHPHRRLLRDLNLVRGPEQQYRSLADHDLTFGQAPLVIDGGNTA
ncbi:hypothetical protein ABZ547_16910 [Streptomyces sparsogenes]|uniref:hypothetical protein n=1 Tax=Streptomyces sparsogenes TaxID=67365 RepID=UPI00340066A3